MALTANSKGFVRFASYVYPTVSSTETPFGLHTGTMAPASMGTRHSWQYDYPDPSFLTSGGGGGVGPQVKTFA